MTTVSASVLTAFIGWSLLLLILMEALRTRLVVKDGQVERVRA